MKSIERKFRRMLIANQRLNTPKIQDVSSVFLQSAAMEWLSGRQRQVEVASSGIFGTRRY
jgi:hypothetical protein